MFILRLTIALVLFYAMACGDDEAQRPAYRADVPENVSRDTQPVSTLDDAQLERVCRSYDAYVQTWVSFESIAYIACLPPAIVLGGSPQGCEQRLDECMALFPEPIELDVQAQVGQVCVDRLGQCDASIAELEGCVNVNLDLALDIVDNWSCRGVDDDRRAEAARAMDTVAVCAEVDDPCAEAVAIGPD
ncbi:MAG: hypothetical protein PVI30_26585 [Myxococcales bacterium]|jgi:hypothetical protein